MIFAGDFFCQPGWQMFGTLAQLVEQRTFNPLVAGSNPARPTRYSLMVFRHQAFLFCAHEFAQLTIRTTTGLSCFPLPATRLTIEASVPRELPVHRPVL